MKKPLFFAILFIIFISLNTFAREITPVFEHISRNEGLPQVSVNAIIQDRQGFMWFGTQGGLARFDGYEFRIFTHKTDDQNSLADNSVWAIVRGDNDILWIGTNGGLSRFNRQTQTFTNFRSIPKNNTGLSDNSIRSLLLDSKGTLWIGTRNGGLNSCQPDINKPPVFKKYIYDKKNPKSISCNYIKALHEDEKKRLWVATYGGGLNCIDLNNIKKGFKHFKYNPKKNNTISSDNVLSIYETKDKNLFVGTDKGLNRLRKNQSSFKRITDKSKNRTKIENNPVSAIIEDLNGNLWIGTGGNGLRMMDRKHHFKSFHSESGMKYSLSGNDIRSLYFDIQGLLWIGTYDCGLNKMDGITGSFSLLRHHNKDNKSLSKNIVISVIEDTRGALWVGTWGGGVNRLKDHRSVDLKLKNKPGDKKTIGGNTVWAIHEDRRGDIWFGTWGGGLSRLTHKQRLKKNPSLIRYRHSPYNPKSISSNSVLSIFEDSRGILWTGTWGGGLNRLDPENIRNGKIRFTKYINNPEDSKSISDNFIKTIIEDRHGNIWIGTWGGGINILDSESIKNNKDKFKRYQKSWTEPNALSHNDILSIYEDQNGIIWIGTYGGGLNRFDPETGQFKNYTRKNGLSNNEVYGILQDKKGFLWLSTNSGLNRFAPDTADFIQYGYRDSLQSDEFNQGAYLKGENGNLYFGGIKGLTYFNPSEIKENSFIPPVLLTEFRIMHEPVPVSKNGILKKPVYMTKSITLNHQHSNFGMTFSALNYRQPERNRFAYMLEGVDKDWIMTDYRHRRSHYTNIDPGTYIFRVKASNDDGKWNEHGASLKVTILPPWWDLWWVKTLALILAGCFLYFLIFIRVRFLRKHEIYLEGQVKERTAEIQRQKEEISIKNKSLSEKNALLKIQAKNLKNLVRRDPLTGLLNRRGFQEKIESECLRVQRNNDTFAILLGDIDFFKKINDSYGHDAGDLVLTEVAAVIINTLRDIDYICRWGGEEFIVLLPETGKEEAYITAERIRKNIEGLILNIKKQQIKVTMTFGIACLDKDLGIEKCIESADKALYKGKDKGRNRVETCV